MTPAGRPEVGPMVSTRYTQTQLIRIDGAAARDGQSRAEWLRNAADRALGAPLDMPNLSREHFTQASHRPDHTDDGRFDAVLLWMSEGEWGLTQRPREDGLVPTDEVQVRISSGGGESPTGASVESLLEPLLPHIERVIRDAEVVNGRLVLGEDAKGALHTIERQVSEACDDLETTPDATDHLVDSIDNDQLLGISDLEAFVNEEAEELHRELGWWVDESAAVQALEERREELRE